MTLAPRRARIPARAFVLLDVILSITILSIVVLTALRSFHQSIRAVRMSEVAERAAMFAEAKLQEFEIDPPEPGRQGIGGVFGEETIYSDKTLFPDADRYRWEAEIEEVEIEYPHIRLAGRDADRMARLTQVTLRVIYDDGPEGDPTWVPVEIKTYLLGHERFSRQARQANGLF